MPALCSAAAPCFAQFGGPSILSRGEAPTGISSVAVKFRPFVEVAANYDTGVAGVQLNDQGQLANRAVYGGSVGWGISGSHQGKRTAVGLTYRGTYAAYRGRQAYGALDQSMMLSFIQRLSTRLTMSFNSTAGINSRDFGLLGLPQSVPFDPATTYIPTTDYFDNRTYYGTAQLGLVIQRSVRLSFSMAGGLYITRRHSAALYGTTGSTATGDMQYRVSRRTTIGGSYTYTHFTVVRGSGTMDAHAFAGTFSRQLTRRAEVTGYAGLIRPETKFVRTTPVDPVIGALLGITSTTQINHTAGWTPMGAARLSWVFRTAVAFISAGRTVTPGNGLFLTTEMSTYTAGYIYTGLRRWSFSAQTAYRAGTSIQNLHGRYNDASVSIRASRTLFHDFHWFAAYAARQYGSPDFASYNRTINEATIGIGYSPGSLPLRVW